jgi:hypothetical protein
MNWDRFVDQYFLLFYFLNFCLYTYFRYGLDSENIPRTARARNVSGGFVDLGNESEYAAAGHQPSGADEVFASEQGDKPW